MIYSIILLMLNYTIVVPRVYSMPSLHFISANPLVKLGFLKYNLRNGSSHLTWWQLLKFSWSDCSKIVHLILPHSFAMQLKTLLWFLVTIICHKTKRRTTFLSFLVNIFMINCCGTWDLFLRLHPMISLMCDHLLWNWRLVS